MVFVAVQVNRVSIVRGCFMKYVNDVIFSHSYVMHRHTCGCRFALQDFTSQTGILLTRVETIKFISF
jgi:hypothetical protein